MDAPPLHVLGWLEASGSPSSGIPWELEPLGHGWAFEVATGGWGLPHIVAPTAYLQSLPLGLFHISSWSFSSVCYGYGTPACVDDKLLPRLLTCHWDVLGHHLARDDYQRLPWDSALSSAMGQPEAWSPRLGRRLNRVVSWVNGMFFVLSVLNSCTTSIHL